MKNPLVSIITPAYKAEQTIKRAVTSVLQQDFPDWEMIIISDDSQNYDQILQEQYIVDKRLQFTSTNQIASGPSNARNKGLEIARGQYIAALDADDEFKPHKLSQMIPLVEKYGAAVSDIEFRNNDSYVLLEKFNQFPSDDFLSAKDIIPVCLHTYSIYLYDKSKITGLYYDNDLIIGEDLVFLMSFFNSIEFVGFTSDQLHIYYRREGSTCNSADIHAVSHKNKSRVVEKIDSGKMSIKDESAKIATRNYMNFSLEIDSIYDQEILHNPEIEWLDIFKTHLQERFLSNL
jgi:glycosyltransferase involved in cell wall biosynthesis